LRMRSRPRWGIFSTRAHTDPGNLAADVLLYDRLVIPTPAEDDLKRWEDKGWRPADLEACLARLGPLAHGVRWDEPLREEVDRRLQVLKAIGRESEDIAYGLTPMSIAMTAWADVFSREGPVPPVPVAAFQSKAEAEAVYAYSSKVAPEELALRQGIAALFRRCVAMPVAVNGPYEAMSALEKAIALSQRADYQDARRAMFDWEDEVLSQKWPVEAAIRELARRMTEHDGLVKKEFGKTVKRQIFRIVGIAGGAIVGTLVAGPAGGFVGALASEGVRALADEGIQQLVEAGTARVPSFESRDTTKDPGAALSMAISAMYR
jgi:hypothetical protein